MHMVTFQSGIVTSSFFIEYFIFSQVPSLLCMLIKSRAFPVWHLAVISHHLSCFMLRLQESSSSSFAAIPVPTTVTEVIMGILRSSYSKCFTMAILWRSLVLFAIAQQFNSLVTSDASSTIPYKAGKLTNAAINVMGNSLGGEIGGHLNWLANSVELFTFPGHDGLILQGYHIPAPSILNHNKPTRPIIIHCAGWSETTIKYSKFLRILHGQGYPIYSFDLRGQGFSSSTGFEHSAFLLLDRGTSPPST